MQQSNPSGQRFLYAVHQFKYLRTGQPEITGGMVLVDMDFDIGEKLGRVLYLVDKHGGLVNLQKHFGVAFRHLPLGQIIQRDVFPPDILLLGQLLQHGGLAHLPGTGQQQRREFFG